MDVSILTGSAGTQYTVNKWAGGYVACYKGPLAADWCPVPEMQPRDTASWAMADLHAWWHDGKKDGRKSGR